MAASRVSAEPLRAPVDGLRYGLAYYRVSTVDQANTSYDEDGFSIQAQRDACQRKAAELGVQLVAEFVDRGKSARTADRPELQALLARIKDDTDIQYVFVHKLDRLARNRQDDVQIGLLFAKSGVRLVSCTENIDDTPSGKLVHGIMADIAEWYSANLSEEAKKGMRKKVEHGGTPYKAPIGYVNARLKITELGKDIGVVRVHEQYGPIITACFKRYDTGLCTLGDVAAYANDLGLRLPADKRLPERLITTQKMHAMLHNRYYTGVVTFGGVEYQGEQPSLIDSATFARVQALLTARDLNKDKSKKRPHHLKGLIFCARCGRRFGISMPTRRATGVSHAYFYCLGHQHDKASCPQTYVRIGKVEDAVLAYWAHVRVPTARIHALRTDMVESFAGLHEQGRTEIAQQRQRIIEWEQRRKKAKAAYYANALELDEFKTEQAAIKQGIAAAEANIAKWSVELESITRSLDDALRLVEDPQALYEALPEGLKAVVLRAVFDRLWILDSTVVGSELTEPFTELLTWEARLAIAEHSTTSSDTAAMDEGATHYRRRVVIPPTVRAWGASWKRPTVERPCGRLPIDKQNPALHRVLCSDIHCLVGVAQFKLNAALARYLHERPTKRAQPSASPTACADHTPKRYVASRLSDTDVAQLIAAFKTGTPKHVLAKRYGIGLTSVKKVLGQHGVKSGQGTIR